ncbi:hypothetical protein ACGLWX_05910 [Halomonas sp. HMF6819]|uniref:hypothetical protein n=1 Tax=Halomonas sp. HMF6819 TaxID=3373085 RepID=UPI00379CCCCC
MATKRTTKAAAETATQSPPETASASPAQTPATPPASVPEVKTEPVPPKAQPPGAAGFVTATLKTRHCDGGVCREAGEQMRMTRGTYARLKKYDRVE